MTLASTFKKFAAAAALTGSVLGLGAGTAAAGPFGFGPSPLPGPSLPTPVEPSTPAPVDTHERPELVSAGCWGHDVWLDFNDPDGSDLRMTVEVGYTPDWHRDAYQIVEAVYVADPDYDKWNASVNADEPWIIAQATDEDGYTSVAIAMKRDADGPGCTIVQRFDSGQDTDFWESTGRR